MISRIKRKLKKVSKRDSLLIFSMATGIMTKIFTVGTALITIPVTLEYLGPESFGLWMLIKNIYLRHIF